MTGCLHLAFQHVSGTSNSSITISGDLGVDCLELPSTSIRGCLCTAVIIVEEVALNSFLWGETRLFNLYRCDIYYPK